MLLEIFHCERQEGERRARERRPESTFHVGDEGIMLFSFLVIYLFYPVPISSPSIALLLSELDFYGWARVFLLVYFYKKVYRLNMWRIIFINLGLFNPWWNKQVKSDFIFKYILQIIFHWPPAFHRRRRFKTDGQLSQPFQQHWWRKKQVW